MEKFSTWRDPSNGIAPFVLPVPTGEDASGPLILAARLFQIVFAAIRFLLFLILVGLFIVLDKVSFVVTIAWPNLSNRASSTLGVLLLRPCLFLCFGFFYIEEEQTASRRRSGSAAKARPRPGDLIVSNWSSFIDIVYLTYKYSPDFLIPVIEAGNAPARYRKYSLPGALAACGQVLGQSEASVAQSLDVIIKNARRPLVLFAEGTTSNNRAILKFAVNKTGPPVHTETKVFLTVLKYDTPSSFRPSVTCPIPASTGNPLPQIVFACTSPIFLPRHLLVRVIPPTESPSLSTPTFWRQVADSMCAVGKLKQTNLGAEEKVSFLEYYQAKSRSKPRESVPKGKRRS